MRSERNILKKFLAPCGYRITRGQPARIVSDPSTIRQLDPKVVLLAARSSLPVAQRVLKAIVACRAARWMALSTASNRLADSVAGGHPRHHYAFVDVAG